MKIITIIVVVVVILLALIIGFAAYWGAFKRIEFRIVEEGGETLVYEVMNGDYRQSGKVMDKVYYSLLNDYKVETFKGFGIYYDNPRKVETSKLRSEVGCILEESDILKVGQLDGKFKIKTYPKTTCIVAEFSYKGKLSVLFGMMKVYPALNKFLIQEGYNEEGAVMEIYDIPAKMIVYRKEMGEKKSIFK
ncbi:MAG: GyrI-like domain-containing protein [Bacteroidales bacterium]